MERWEIDIQRREARERRIRKEIRNRHEENLQNLLGMKILERQPFVVFTYEWREDLQMSKYRHSTAALQAFDDFRNTIEFLVCFLIELNERIGRGDTWSAKAKRHLAVEHIAHGVVCQLDARQVLQIARDFAILNPEGTMSNVHQDTAHVTSAFLALAAATNGIVATNRSVTSLKAGLSDEWGRAIEERRKKVQYLSR